MSALPLKADIPMQLNRLHPKLRHPKMATRENAPEVPLRGERLTSLCSFQPEAPLTGGAFPGFFEEIWPACAERWKTRD